MQNLTDSSTLSVHAALTDTISLPLAAMWSLASTFDVCSWEFRTSRDVRFESAMHNKADIHQRSGSMSFTFQSIQRDRQLPPVSDFLPLPADRAID
jgi:hypothetical protein